MNYYNELKETLVKNEVYKKVKEMAHSVCRIELKSSSFAIEGK